MLPVSRYLVHCQILLSPWVAWVLRLVLLHGLLIILRVVLIVLVLIPNEHIIIAARYGRTPQIFLRSHPRAKWWPDQPCGTVVVLPNA